MKNMGESATSELPLANTVFYKYKQIYHSWVMSH